MTWKKLTLENWLRSASVNPRRLDVNRLGILRLKLVRESRLGRIEMKSGMMRACECGSFVLFHLLPSLLFKTLPLVNEVLCGGDG